MQYLYELSSTGQTRRSRANDSNVFTRKFGGRDGPGYVKSSLPAYLTDSTFHVFDSDWLLDNAQHTGSLARRGTNSTREFREIVGLCHRLMGRFPLILKQPICKAIYSTLGSSFQSLLNKMAASIGYLKKRNLRETDLVHQIVPVRNQIAERASKRRLTEGYTAVHATSCLHFECLPDTLMRIYFRPVGEAFSSGTVLRLRPGVLNKAAQFVRFF